jgi:hypothetical protein
VSLKQAYSWWPKKRDDIEVGWKEGILRERGRVMFVVMEFVASFSENWWRE